MRLAFNRVGLGQLGQVLDQVPGDIFPRVTLWQSEVDMRTGQLVDVKLQSVNMNFKSQKCPPPR